MLQAMFGTKKKKLTGKGRQLHNYFIILFHQMEENEMGTVCRVNGEKR
jgi:hypothetical protein